MVSHRFLSMWAQSWVTEKNKVWLYLGGLPDGHRHDDIHGRAMKVPQKESG